MKPAVMTSEKYRARVYSSLAMCVFLCSRELQIKLNYGDLFL